MGDGLEYCSQCSKRLTWGPNFDTRNPNIGTRTIINFGAWGSTHVNPRTHMLGEPYGGQMEGGLFISNLGSWGALGSLTEFSVGE